MLFTHSWSLGSRSVESVNMMAERQRKQNAIETQAREACNMVLRCSIVAVWMSEPNHEGTMAGFRPNAPWERGNPQPPEFAKPGVNPLMNYLSLTLLSGLHMGCRPCRKRTSGSHLFQTGCWFSPSNTGSAVGETYALQTSALCRQRIHKDCMSCAVIASIYSSHLPV